MQFLLFEVARSKIAEDCGEENMLKGVDPLLSPDLLFVLQSMGHGDEVCIVDGNFPAASLTETLVRADGVDAVSMTAAILSVLPLDTYADGAAFSMAVVDASLETPPIVAEFQSSIDELADPSLKISPLERFAFYERAKNAFAIVATSETRLYGNLILKKGVIDPAVDSRT